MEAFQGNDQAMTRTSLYGTYSEATYAGVTSFMRRRYSRDLTGVDVVVSGVPFDTAATTGRALVLARGRSARHRSPAPGSGTGRGNSIPSTTWR